MARPKPDEPPVQFALVMEPSLNARLRVYARTKGLKVNPVIRSLLDQALRMEGF